MKDTRPVLVGMNNPLSDDPRHALYPLPGGSAGARVLGLVRQGATRGVSTTDYLCAFDRRNVLGTRKWDRTPAVLAGREMWETLRGRTVVVFGNEAWRALRLPLRHPLVLPLIDDATDPHTTWRLLPHPSGRCRWYNDPRNRMLAALLLAELGGFSSSARGPRLAPPPRSRKMAREPRLKKRRCVARVTFTAEYYGEPPPFPKIRRAVQEMLNDASADRSGGDEGLLTRFKVSSLDPDT